MVARLRSTSLLLAPLLLLLVPVGAALGSEASEPVELDVSYSNTTTLQLLEEETPGRLLEEKV